MTAPTKIRPKDLATIRAHIQIKQGNKCCVCDRKFSKSVVGCLDHNHQTGFIRGVLCRACNRLEGQVNNRVKQAGGKENPVAILRKLADYWELHMQPQSNLLHPTHKTDLEKRLARNKKARERRAALKGK